MLVFRDALKKENAFFVKDFYLNGVLQMEGFYKDKLLKQKTDTFKSYYLNGKTSSIIAYKNGKKHGEAKWYFITGKLSKLANYNMGELTGKWMYYNEEGNIDCEIEDVNINKVKELYRSPIYFEGKDALNEYLKKVIDPLEALGDQFYGRTSAYFKIDDTGKVIDVDIILHGTIEMDSIIIKHILKMPKWEPAIENGKPVSYRHYIPFKFSGNSKTLPISDKKLARGFFVSGVKDYKEGEYDEAVFKFKQAVIFNKMEAKYHYYSGHGYYKTWKKDFACEYWKIADMLDSKILKKEIKDLCNIK
ncbi:MAG: hypothetical protein L3J14_07905 [Flavobacteriaceae bacterium]|nr:hypothetical protein [Flavobacteriaceae bacterium]